MVNTLRVMLWDEEIGRLAWTIAAGYRTLHIIRVLEEGN